MKPVIHAANVRINSKYVNLYIHVENLPCGGTLLFTNDDMKVYSGVMVEFVDEDTICVSSGYRMAVCEFRNEVFAKSFAQRVRTLIGDWKRSLQSIT